MEEDGRPGPIDNSVLCIPDPSGSKKLPSLTNEGTHSIAFCITSVYYGVTPANLCILLCHNSPLLHDALVCVTGGRLVRQLLVEGKQFVLLPEVIWKVFTLWYGTAGYSGGPALPRMVRNYINKFQ